MPLRILVAEDNDVNQKIAVQILGRLGYLADLVANGREAVAAVEREGYDLVFMDVQMPEMDGLEATRRILLRTPPSRRPRIVAMTAHALTGDRERCLAAGMDDFVTKPVSIPEVAAAIERAGTARASRGETSWSEPPVRS